MNLLDRRIVAYEMVDGYEFPNLRQMNLFTDPHELPVLRLSYREGQTILM